MSSEEFLSYVDNKKRQLSARTAAAILHKRSKARSKWNRIAKRIRAALILALGGQCAKCGTDRHLEFDHINPTTRTWVARHKSQLGRLRHYRQDAALGLIQLLCHKHNHQKGRS